MMHGYTYVTDTTQLIISIKYNQCLTVMSLSDTNTCQTPGDASHIVAMEVIHTIIKYLNQKPPSPKNKTE